MKTNQPTQFSAERIKSNETNSWKRDRFIPRRLSE